MFYFYHLYTNRHLIRTRETPCKTQAEERERMLQLRSLSILFDVYEPRFWFWEVIETVYRLCLTGVLVLVNEGSSTQILMGLLFSLVFIKLYELCKPYQDHVIQRIKDISLWQIFFIFGCALLINGEYVESQDTYVVVFMVFVIFVNMLVDVLRWFYVSYIEYCTRPAEAIRASRSERSSSITSRKSTAKVLDEVTSPLGSSCYKQSQEVELAAADKRI